MDIFIILIIFCLSKKNIQQERAIHIFPQASYNLYSMGLSNTVFHKT